MVVIYGHTKLKQICSFLLHDCLSMYGLFLPPCINKIISMINLGKLLQHKSIDLGIQNIWEVWRCLVYVIYMWLVLCYLLFLFIGGFFRENLMLPKKHKNNKKIPKSKMSTWGITSVKNDSNAHLFYAVCSELPFS